MPNICSNKITASGNMDTLVYIADFIRSDKRQFDFNTIIPYPENFRLLDEATPGKYKGYNSGGYDWCILNWGTKWNAMDSVSDIDGKDLVITFDTAWSPSFDITKKLSELFPTVRFMHNYEEAGMDFSGYTVFENGKVVGGDSGAYGDFPVFEEDEEDEGEDVGG